ncbi:precorrin-2 C(20)-methyltransferase [delta proteobacterium NaphS2]|nr:precorrin-2 C(20)-methyltransferase [delta proteobacterium NaphS2]
MQNGTLYGIGVGPGDPDLITLKAAKILQQVETVFAAASTKNSHSIAMEILSPHMNSDVPVVRLGFPMTRSKIELAHAWENNAHQVMEFLKQGRKAAFITLGDPMLYSTFGYMYRTIRNKAPDIPIEIVPGITSYQAGAAAAGEILAEAEESVAVISGALGAQNLKRIIHQTDNVVMLKVYRNYGKIMDMLDELGLMENATLISRCGLEDQEIIHDLRNRPDVPPPYLSLLLIRKNNRNG